MNNLEEIKTGVMEALEKAFIFVEESESNSVDLSDYIEDSLQFMSFIVNLEDKFSLEIPAELMMFDNFKHIDDICEMLFELLS